MKKKLLIVLPLILLICFSSTAKAMTSEEGTGVDSGGLHDYMQWFADFSGVLSIATTTVNNSGMMTTYVITSVLCVNESRNFRLRVYDSDEKKFIGTQNENGLGSMCRQFKVRTHMDTLETWWTVYVTDMTGEIFYAQITLHYTYDEDAEWTPPGEEDPDTISQEEYDKKKKEWRIKAWTWFAQGFVGAIAGLFIGIKLTNRLYGAG